MNSSPQHSCLRMTCLSLAASFFCQSSWSTNEDFFDLSLEELTNLSVTARKREEKLNTIPLSLHILTEVDLREYAIGELSDITFHVPGLNATVGQSGSASEFKAYIRGIGEWDAILTSDPAVGLYLDGVYTARVYGTNIEQMDIKRIEVLKGPQGTLFGKNSIAGAINIISNKPADYADDYLKISYGSFDERNLQLATDIIPSNELSFRWSGGFKQAEGWQERPDYKAASKDSWQFRLASRWQPTSNTDYLLSVYSAGQEQTGVANNLIAAQNSELSTAYSQLLGTPCCHNYVNTDPDRSAATSRFSVDEFDIMGLTLDLNWQFDDFTTKAISGYRHINALNGRDGDGSPLAYSEDLHDQKQTQFSQEIQLFNSDDSQRLNWLGGLYYFTEHSAEETTLITAEGFYEALVAAGTPEEEAALADFNIDYDNHQDSESYAAFFHGTYDITEQWVVDFGLRYTLEKKTFKQAAWRRAADVPLFSTREYKLDDDWDAWSPKLGISFKAFDNLLFYGYVARGFRSGGYNGRPTRDEEVGSYDPEFLTSYETGFKTQLLNNRLDLTGALFYNQYTDMQVTSALGDDETDIIVITENAAEATLKGIDFNIQAIVVDNWRLRFGLTYLDTGYDDYVNTEGLDFSGRKLRNAPKWDIHFSSQYVIRLENSAAFTLQADYNYRDDMYLDDANSPLILSENFSSWNAAVTYEPPGKEWSLAITGNNLNDKRVLTAGFDASDSFGFADGYYNPPKTYKAVFTYKLN